MTETLTTFAGAEIKEGDPILLIGGLAHPAGIWLPKYRALSSAQTGYLIELAEWVELK